MPEIKIKIDPQTHAKLKQFAREDDRSLTKYLTRGLIYLSNHPYHQSSLAVLTSDPTKSSDIIDLSGLPEGSTIRVQKKTAAPVPKRDLIKEAYEYEGIFSNSLRIHRRQRRPVHR